MVKRGRPAAYKRLCVRCAAPKDLQEKDIIWYMRPRVVTVNGEIAYLRHFPPSRPVVCDRCFEAVTVCYELHPEQEPPDVHEVFEQQRFWRLFSFGIMGLMLAGVCVVVLFTGTYTVNMFAETIKSMLELWR